MLRVRCDECGVEIQSGDLACKDCFKTQEELVEEARKERDGLQGQIDQNNREIIDLKNAITSLERELKDAKMRLADRGIY